MGTLLIPHHDVRLGHLHLGRGIHEVLEQMPRLGLFVAPADAAGQQAVQAAGHQRQLQVAVDLHRHGRAQGVHVKEVDPIRDPILDDHPLSVPLNQPGSRRRQLVGQQEGRLLMTQVGDRHLAQRAVIISQSDPAIEDSRMVVLARDTLRLDPAPRGAGRPVDFLHQSFRARRNVMNRIPSRLSSLSLA